MKSSGLLALACGTFALGVAEFSMMGILSPLAHDMDVTIPQAGDFISAYALGVSLGAPLPLLFRNRPLKHILLGLCLLIVLGNGLAALAPGYVSLICARFLAGLPHGAYFGVGAIVAVHLVPPGYKATAVAIMVTGMTVANVLGVPAVTWLTNAFSWRLTFLLAALWGAIAFAGILGCVPAAPAPKEQSFSRQVRFLKGPAPWLIFAATFLGQGSVYCWYSYMEPILQEVTHIPAGGMKWVMVLAGLGMFTGGLLCGRLADRFRPALVSACTAMGIVPILLGIYLFSAQAFVALPLVFLGAAALFGLGGPMQYLIVRYSRGGEILGGAGIQIAFNMSNACSAYLGGMAIRHGYGLVSPALLGIPMALVCAGVLLWFWRRYPAKPGD